MKLLYRHRWFLAAALTVGTAVPATAQNYVFDIDNSLVAAAPVKQQNPGFPGSHIRRGQEGWVRLNFVITPDGRAVDPIVIDSTGGADFEKAARKALADWRFEPSETMLANNVVNIRFEIYRGRDKATSNFMRRYQRIMMHLRNEENEDARAQVDAAQALGGWNLYETTMLCLMLGRVDGAEGNISGKQENYERALAVSNRNSLGGEDRRELLAKLFDMQFDRAQYAAARTTLDLLRMERSSDREIVALAEKIAALDRRLEGDEPLRAQATVYNPCDCEAGNPVWSYEPARRTFSFANLSGNVERFEVRCEHDRLQDAVEAGNRWTAPGDAGSCRVFVFGDDGATFEFVEHGDAETGPASEPPAVARGNVLD